MPRGRHRQSPPLHRLLPPSAVAGASIACAAGAWCVGDDLVQRVLAAGAAAAALTGAVLLRTWDRNAGRRVAELTRARVRDEWRTEERIAELETDVEEAREIRAGLETKLRAKRAELARLRSEHAALLRRYATAETERASALEGRRLLAIEAAPAKALPAAGLPRLVNSPLRLSTSSAQEGAAHPSEPLVPGRREPATYAQADQALRRLARNAARQRAAQQARAPKGGAEDLTPSGPPARRGDRAGRDGAQGRGKAPAAAAQRTDGTGPAGKATAAGPALRPVPATASAVTPSRPATSRATGGFDFFGNAADSDSGPRQLTGPMEEDLADVVGDEAVAEHSARTQPSAESAEADARPSGQDEPSGPDERNGQTDGETTTGSGEVIDLTAHDETEQFEIGALRTAIS
ncbi:hypothetical protein [Streptomyces sp. NPDC048611]|uniref:hypothetical protein n=1 Tax=Streptomyces sp. NPDC048611 TaxID=3155635 RepID=UPI00342B4862